MSHLVKRSIRGLDQELRKGLKEQQDGIERCPDTVREEMGRF